MSSTVTGAPREVGREPTGNPYHEPLQPFREADAASFVGRDELSELLVAYLESTAVTVVYGPSGVGKTSVLRAGVAARLREISRDSARRRESGLPAELVVVVSSWRDDPSLTIVDALNAALADAADPARGADLGAHLLARPAQVHQLADAIESWLRKLQCKLYLILDQFESYFDRDHGSDAFADALGVLVHRRDASVDLMISIRQDSLSLLDRWTGRVVGLFESCVEVGHLDREAAIEAIQRPLAQHGGKHAQPVPEDVVEQILAASVVDKQMLRDDFPAAEQRYRAAILELVLYRLYEDAVRAGAPTLQASKPLTDRILSDHVAAGLRAVPFRDRRRAVRILRVLARRSSGKVIMTADEILADVGSERVPVHRPRERRRVERTLEQLTQARLLEAGGGDRPGERTYQVMHDLLLEPIRVLALEQQARERVFRLLAWGVAAVVLAVVVVAVVLHERSVNARATANAVNLEADIATGKLATDPVLALQLALDAAGRSTTPASTTALRQTIGAGGLRRIYRVPHALGSRVGSQRAVFSPNGDYAAVADDGSVTLFRPGHGPQRLTTGFLRNARTIAFDRTGALLAAGGLDGARVWSTATGAPLGPLIDGTEQVNSVAFDPRGELVALAGNGGDLALWRRSTRTTIRVQAGTNVSKVVFSPDGTHIAVVDGPGVVDVFDRDGARVWRVPGAPLPRGAKAQIAFLPDGRLVTALPTGVTRVWRVGSTAPALELRSTASGGNQPASVAVSPRGTRIAVGRGNVVRVYRTRDAVLDGELIGHLDDIASIAFSPDGGELLTASHDDTARVWDVTTDRTVAVLTGDTDDVNSAAFSADGRMAVTASSDGEVRLWALPVAERTYLRDSGVARSVSVADTGALVATWDTGVAVAWSRGFRRTATLPRVQTGDTASTATISKDGTLVAVGSDLGEIRLWRPFAPGGSRVWRLQLGTGNVTSVSFSADRRLLAVGTEDPSTLSGAAAVWDVSACARALATVGCARRLSTLRPSAGVKDVSFSPDGRYVVTANVQTGEHRGQADVFVARSGRLVARLLHRDEVESASFSSDGQRIVTASYDTTARVWQWPSRSPRPQPLVTLDRCALFPGCDRLRSASFPPTGHDLVVTASFDRTAVVWHADSGHIETVLDGNASTVTSAHFSDGARYVLTASSDGTARLWDTQTGVQLEEYDHPARLTRAIFGPHDHWIATASADGAVRIWPVAPPTGDAGALRRRALLRLAQLGVEPLSPDQRSVLLPSA